MVDVPNELMESEPGPHFDLRQILIFGVARSRRWILTLAVIGLVIGGIVAILEPNAYTSRAKLFLLVGQREQVTFDTMLGEVEGPGVRGPTILDEVHMLSDRAIYAKVVERLGANEVLRPADPSHYDGDETPLLVRALHEAQAFLYGFRGTLGLTAHGSQEAARVATKVLYESTALITEVDSNVIIVEHTSNAPERARDYNQAIVDAFVERHTQQFTAERFLEENRLKLQAAEVRRDDANKAYFDLLESCGLYDFETQRPALIEELEEQESELHTARTERNETSAQRGALEERLRGMTAQIAVVGQPLANPKYEELRDSIDELDVRVAGLEARITSLEAWVTEKRAELDRMRDCEKQHAYLASVRESADERYQTLMRRYEMLEGLAGLREEASNLRILQAPDLDDQKVGPQRGKMLVVGLLGGAFTGVLVALGRELLDRRLRYPHAIERALGVRVLDVIPDVTDLGDERHAA